MKRSTVTTLVGAGLALLVLGALPLSGVAQDDYRHLDEGRPLRVEDAYPIKFREWEWELGSELGAAEGGTREAGTILELKTGIFRNAQLGLEAHGAIERVAGVSEAGIEELQLHLLYNLNQEGAASPAVGLRIDVQAPGFGDLARADAGARIKAIATRTIGWSRVHVNAGHRWRSGADGDDVWELGIAVDRALGLSSRMLAADVFVEASPRTSARIWLDLGGRLQLNKRTALDAGVFSRLDQWSDGVANVGFTVGISRAFGIRALVPLGPYPNPRLR